MIYSFLFAFFATFGFSILFHVPKKLLFWASVVGGLGYFIYDYCISFGHGKVIACFIGSYLIGLLGDILARLFRETATVFVIPGIIPLVPGAGMYYTMLATVNGDLSLAARTGTETILVAGAIAVALLVEGSITNMFVLFFKRLGAKKLKIIEVIETAEKEETPENL